MYITTDGYGVSWRTIGNSRQRLVVAFFFFSYFLDLEVGGNGVNGSAAQQNQATDPHISTRTAPPPQNRVQGMIINILFVYFINVDFIILGFYFWHVEFPYFPIFFRSFYTLSFRCSHTAGSIASPCLWTWWSEWTTLIHFVIYTGNQK